jgi:hypothetical protein
VKNGKNVTGDARTIVLRFWVKCENVGINNMKAAATLQHRVLQNIEARVEIVRTAAVVAAVLASMGDMK